MVVDRIRWRRCLRIHCMQLFYNLSDPGMEDALYEIESMRRFAGLRLFRLAAGRDDDPQFPSPSLSGTSWVRSCLQRSTITYPINGLMMREGSIN